MSESDAKPVKLPYFHRTLSPQDAALIGDTTPKPITNSTAQNAPNDANRTVREASAWNAAQTWEERDCSTWGKSKVRELFDSTNEEVTFSNPSKVEGHASITHVRGRARFLYEWDFSVDVSVATSSNGTVTMTVDAGEVINDQLEDIVLTPNWKTKGLTRDVQKAVLKTVQDAIVEKMREFEAQFREYQP